MTTIEIIDIAGPRIEVTCTLCQERHLIGNGAWPAVKVPGKDAYKPVCLGCASIEEPAMDYGRDWQDILDDVAMGTYAMADEAATATALADLAAEAQRRRS
jgi:hypothetical protein